ncbi:transcriptional regulator [Geobacillus subterraneus]|uniref:Transcriptional regulator n=2 Tax=Geobacillus TaxID=129337 RepID=A0ABM6AEW0_9BACL|nr:MULTISPECIES: pro-sigmaK processing inhibitor BofA family protein [Geobacillus]AMX84926.1 transcriptional regulator [Geobacillus subterraneus]KZS25861.1 transcriptional regulator [Geobacillus subterraneus]OXB85120.1 transcriptional regulator [Geobacillus uzenensis]QIZ66243.1 pro-sigmaK processing inhibitor BofA [Geobacillus subterraneus]WPZ18445.1 pro-sigmaK processing inhibitor BofA family protein [Geobacillus subterraneus]
MEPEIVITVLLTLIAVLLIVGARLKALRFVGYAAIRLIVGALALFVINAVGGHFNIHIPINLITSLVCGFLGLPGAAALIVIDQYIL